MELMKKLKAKSMKKAILPILAAVLVAVILLAVRMRICCSVSL